MSNYKLSAESVKQLSQGRWLEIYSAFNILPSDFLSKADHSHSIQNISGACPICGGVDRFGFFKDGRETGGASCRQCGAYPDGLALLKAVTNKGFYDVLNMVNDYLGGAPIAPITPRRHQPSDKTGLRAAVAATLKHCKPEPSAAHRAYLDSRQLPIIKSASALYHGGAPYYVRGKPLKDRQGRWITYPAIVARISSARGWHGVLLTYLTKDGQKADQELKQHVLDQGYDAKDAGARRFIVPEGLTGGAIRLGKADKVLLVCEGLETGLALHQLTNGSAAIACGMTANNMQSVDIPDNVERVIICADNDLSGTGLNAAESLRERLGKKVYCDILLPEIGAYSGSKGVDYADIALHQQDTLARKSKRVLLLALK